MWKDAPGAFALTFAALSSSASQALLKQATKQEGLPGPQSALFRACAQLLFLWGPMMMWRRIPILPLKTGAERSWRRYILGQGFVGGLNMLCAVAAVELLALGDGQALQDMYPVITAFFACVFLKEPFQRTSAVALPVIILGTVLITRPSFLFGSVAPSAASVPCSSFICGTLALSLGRAVAFTASLCMAVKFVLVRKAKNADTLQLVVWLNVFQIIVALAASLAPGQHFVTPSLRGWLFIAGITATNMMYIFAMTWGQQKVPAAFASVLQSTDIVWSYFLEVVMFHSTPSVTSLTGASCIVLATVVLTLERCFNPALASSPRGESPELCSADAQSAASSVQLMGA